MLSLDPVETVLQLFNSAMERTLAGHPNISCTLLLKREFRYINK